jgi:hypothetical protein
MKKSLLAALVLAIAIIAGVVWYQRLPKPPVYGLNGENRAPLTSEDDFSSYPNVYQRYFDKTWSTKTSEVNPELAYATGRLMDPDRGVGIEGATVRATAFETSRGGIQRYATTDEKGRYRIGPLFPANWKFEIISGSWWIESVEHDRTTFFSVHDLGPIALGDTYLNDHYTVRGTVKEASGRPVADALIKLGYESKYQRTRTNDQGDFRFVGFYREDDWTLTAAHEGYILFNENLSKLRRKEQRNFNIVLHPASTITGKIHDTSRSTYIFGFVLAYPETWTGDVSATPFYFANFGFPLVGEIRADGAFMIPHLAPGSHKLYVRESFPPTFSTGHTDSIGPPYHYSYKNIQDTPEAAIVHIGEREHLSNVEIEHEFLLDRFRHEMHRNGFHYEKYRGIVTDENGNPVSGGTFSDGRRFSSYVDAKGEFEIKGSFITPDFVIMDDLSMRHVEVTTNAEKLIEVVLKRVPTIKGRVVDALTGDPISNFVAGRPWQEADRFALKLPFADAINPYGNFEVEKSEHQPNLVKVFAPGYRPNTINFDARPSEADELIFKMEKSPVIEGEVVDANGDPVAAARIFVGRYPRTFITRHIHHDHFAHTYTDVSGKFLLNMLPESVGQITAYHPDWEPQTLPALLNGREHLSTKFRFTRQSKTE